MKLNGGYGRIHVVVCVVAQGWTPGARARGGGGGGGGGGGSGVTGGEWVGSCPYNICNLYYPIKDISIIM